MLDVFEDDFVIQRQFAEHSKAKQIDGDVCSPLNIGAFKYPSPQTGDRIMTQRLSELDPVVRAIDCIHGDCSAQVGRSGNGLSAHISFSLHNDRENFQKLTLATIIGPSLSNTSSNRLMGHTVPSLKVDVQPVSVPSTQLSESRPGK